MHIILPKQVNKALALLENGGHEAYIVGGCVRDALLQRAPKDYDITTSALPQQILAVFKNYPTYKAGLRHGTVGVVIDHLPIEITTYRTGFQMSDPHSSPGRQAWAKTIREDLGHRDFTINALAYHHQQGLVDSYQGRRDLQAGLVRCVGDPDQRFGEDGLRVLRAVRFASEYGFTIASSTAQSMHKNKGLLQSIAPERLATELAMLICGAHVQQVLLDFSDILGVIIPELLPTRGFKQHHHYHIHDVWTHTVKVVGGTPPILSVRLAALFHDLGKPDTFSLDAKGVGHFYGHGKISATVARKVLRRLRFDRATTRRVYQLVLHHDTPVVAEEKKIKRWLNKLSESVFRELLYLKKADILAQNPAYFGRLDELERINVSLNRIIAKRQCYSLSDLAVNGRDLISLGVPQGPAIGKALDYLLDAVMEGKLPNERKSLLKAIRMPE